MPYPPRPPRKHATNEEAQAARWKALQPYQYQPGQSGNPEGLGATRRAQLDECERLARAEGPQSIARLAWLRDNSPDDRVQTRAAEILLSRLPPPRQDVEEESPLENMTYEEKARWFRGMVAYICMLPELHDDGSVREVFAPDGECEFCDRRRDGLLRMAASDLAEAKDSVDWRTIRDRRPPTGPLCDAPRK